MALISRFIIIIFLGVAGIAVAQNDTIKLAWRKPVSLVLNGKYKDIISFDLADHKRKNQYFPSYSLAVKGAYSTSVELINTEWISLTEQDYRCLPESYILEQEAKVFYFNSDERGISNTKIEIVPLRKGSSGKLEKLLKFQVRTNLSSPPVTIKSTNQSQGRLSAISNSVLAEGDWYKLSFSNSGIYKIDYNFIKSLGLKPDEINIENLQLWGNGGGMLPERIADFRKEDLNETPIFVNTGGDGIFSEEDYILFYAQGPNLWQPQQEFPFFKYSKHLYSKTSHYFLTIGNVPGKRIATDVNNENPDLTLSSFTSRQHHEQDLTNFLASGRKWFGEEFDNNNVQSFNFPANSIVSGSPIHVSSSFLNKSIQSFTLNSFNLTINRAPFKTYSLYGGGAGVYDRIGTDAEYKDQISSDNFVGQKNLEITIRYNKNAGVGVGFLDYLSLVFEDDLVITSNPTTFRHVDSKIDGVVQYNLKLSSPSQWRVWDITDLGNIAEPFLEVSNNNAYFKYNSDTTIREFISFLGSNFPSPSIIGKINNQNIRSNNTPNMLIVTHPLFREQANKLADFKRKHDTLDVVVVTTDEVYNEFSSGSQDLVAIRDCARMFYEKDIDKFKYILLIGDCSYDYKNIKNLASNQNFIPIYESEESLYPTETYSSDDYIGLLSLDEGVWLNEEDLDVGIGRLPVKTAEEAEGVIQKIFHYSLSPSTLGPWRQNLTFIADNEEGNEFLDNAESLSVTTDVLRNNYNIKKVYLAAYPKDVTGATPGANEAIAKEFENGTFMMNYIGHGGERQLASENIINLGTIAALKNFDRLPFMVTATCDFGKYDDPNLTSGGELFLLNPSGGAIGLLCTTRPVFQNYNKRINGEFYKFAFSDVARSTYRLGDLMRGSKNGTIDGSGIFIRNFSLLGDPSLKPAYPHNDVVITKINGKDFVPFADTLKAQSKVTITGNISNKGIVLSDFNGAISSLVFDKASTVNTIDLPLISFNIMESKIFDGSATVKNGQFEITFIVPRNINYIVGAGKISLYANAEDGRMVDASGGFSNILIGGGDNNVDEDITPPQVKYYINDESFVQNGITNENPLLVIKLSDENGISSIGDVGGNITYTISDKPGEEIILNNYYKSDRDTYKSGTIKYRLSNLEEGPKWIKVKAFDSKKNKNKDGDPIEFVVVKHGNLKIDKLLNYPNPFTTNTVFHFDHNRAGDDLDILLQVFTITGKLVKSLSLHTPSASTHISDLVWDGKDDYGDNIGRGVYVYKLSVKALSDGTKKDEYQKLVILN